MALTREPILYIASGLLFAVVSHRPVASVKGIICPPGFHVENKICVPNDHTNPHGSGSNNDPCPEGQHLDLTDHCVADSSCPGWPIECPKGHRLDYYCRCTEVDKAPPATPPPPPPPPTQRPPPPMPATTTTRHPSVLPPCPPGQHRDGAGRCVGCPTACKIIEPTFHPKGTCPGCTKWDPHGGHCIPCCGPRVTTPKPAPTCPPGQYMGPAGYCQCPPGMVVGGPTGCIYPAPPTCPPGHYRGHDGQCHPYATPPPHNCPQGNCSCPICTICVECSSRPVSIAAQICLNQGTNHRQSHCLQSLGLSSASIQNLLNARSDPFFMDILKRSP